VRKSGLWAVKAEYLLSLIHRNGASDGGVDFPVDPSAPDPEVVPGTSEFGNRYSKAFKLKVLRETDACTLPGELGRYLRSAGITHATLTCFRKQRASGALDLPRPVKPKVGASEQATGQKGSTERSSIEIRRDQDGDQTRRVLELERDVRNLKRRLEQAEAIIDIQKKVSRLLESSLDETDPPGSK
jgi:transposase